MILYGGLIVSQRGLFRVGPLIFHFSFFHFSFLGWTGVE